MFQIDADTKTINITRGDIATIVVSSKNSDGTDYTFQNGDVIRLGVFEQGNMNSIVLEKDVNVTEATQTVEISLNKEDTTIGDIINAAVNYWYEIQLNPDTYPQTIVGFDKAGAKIFKLFPEGIKKGVEGND